MERLKAMLLQLREASPFCSVFPNGLSPVSIYTCEWREIVVKAEPGQVSKPRTEVRGPDHNTTKSLAFSAKKQKDTCERSQYGLR